MSNAYKAAAAAVIALRRGTRKGAPSEAQMRAAQNLEDAMDSIADAERGLNEWREMALSQAGDAGVVARMVKAETEVALLHSAMRDEIDEGLRLRELGGALPDENITAMTERVIAERDALRKALRLAREGYSSEAATGLPVVPQWRERTMALINEALKD